ncbi:MAG: VWA domain-containing protein [Cytophagaceae bacterium]|nr:VWA domain-containing protein [Cytophagaceae bacterium]
MNTILQLSLTGILLSISTLFAFHSSNPDRPVTSDGLVYKPSTLSLLPPQESTVTSAPLVQDKKVQVVFALDATGSMSGLIGTAKEKIWPIASSFAQDPTTQVEVGLIFYRDRGDAFVTRKIQLSKDLDDVYEQLMTITADGGGDGPESMNQGLYEAVTLMPWNTDTTVFKSIFLVGDYESHMDYPNDVKYSRSCSIAKEKDILINTILMGNNDVAKKIWKEIAACSGGEFLQVDMNANNLTVTTPYDDKIADVSTKMDDTRIYYGSNEQKQKQYIKKSQSDKLNSGITSSTAARRAEYNNNTKSGKDAYIGDHELVNDYKSKKVDLTKIPTTQLPDAIQKMDVPQREKYLDSLTTQRDQLQKEMDALIVQRKAYIEVELKKKKKEEVSESFDNKVYENVKRQAAKKNIEMKDGVKY